jgi:hypothetical protein
MTNLKRPTLHLVESLRVKLAGGGSDGSTVTVPSVCECCGMPLVRFGGVFTVDGDTYRIYSARKWSDRGELVAYCLSDADERRGTDVETIGDPGAG